MKYSNELVTIRFVAVFCIIYMTTITSLAQNPVRQDWDRNMAEWDRIEPYVPPILDEGTLKGIPVHVAKDQLIQQQAREAQQRAQQRKAIEAKRAREEKQLMSEIKKLEQQLEARELEARREAEEQRRLKQERENKRIRQGAYDEMISQTSDEYAAKKARASQMASPEASNTMYRNMGKTRLKMSIGDVSVATQKKQVTTSSSLERLKQRKNKNNLSGFDEASLFTLSHLNKDIPLNPVIKDWPYDSHIPITNTLEAPLFNYETPRPHLPAQEYESEQNEAFDKSLASLDVNDLQYVKQTYEEYSELAELADYSYHEKPLSSELVKGGWCDVSTENPFVKNICSEAENGGSSWNGLKLSVLRKGDRYVIAFGGTDYHGELKDCINDVKTDLVGEFSPEEEQAQRAKEAVGKLINKCGIPIDKIEFTGHSLGGRIAAEMSVEFVRPATTYNAAGVSEKTRNKYETLVKSNGSYLGIRNITTEHDIVTNDQELASATSPYLNNSLVKKLYYGASKKVFIVKSAYYLSYVDKRAIGAKVVLPDAKGRYEAHELSSVKESLNSRYNSVLKALNKKSLPGPSNSVE